MAAIVLAAILAVGGCREQSPDDYVSLTGKVFIFNYRVATATYVVTLGKLKPIPDGATVTGQFENPDGGEPHVVLQKIWPDVQKIVLESPALTCVRKDRAYKISVVIKDGDGKALQQVDTTLTSTLDQDILPDRPLVVGPVYTPNPDLVGHPDGKLGDAPGACPQ
ncbi:MAG: hypothetical protein WCC66_06910 [Rhizobiaceae bacterium]